MIDKSKLSKEVIPGIEEVYANYGAVLPAGIYHVSLGDTTHIKFTTGRNKKGRPYTALNGMTFRVVGDRDNETEGAPVGATLRFQKSWIETIVNGVLTKSQIASGEGVPLSTEAQADFLDKLAKDKTALKVKVDWKAFDTVKYNEILVALTDSGDREDPIEMAKQLADDDQKAEASEAATLAETYTDFPINEKLDDGSRLSFIPTETGEVRAQANIVRFFLATAPAEVVETEEEVTA